MNNILYKLLKLFPPYFYKHRCSQKKLSAYIEFANLIIQHPSLSFEEKRNGLLHLQKQLAITVQGQLNHQVIHKKLHSLPKRHLYYVYHPLMVNSESASFNIKPAIQLPNFPVISEVWHKERLVDTFSKIGELVSQPFKEQPNTHHSNLLIYPINLVIVGNGLHSVSTGMMESQAKITLDEVINIKSSFKSYYFDGHYFRSYQNPNFFYSIPFRELGIMYEIGRLAMENNLTFNFHL